MATTAQNNAEQRAVTRRKSRRQDTGQFMPRAFSKDVKRRFDRERRRDYLALLSGPPSNSVAARIDSLVRLEWHALKAEAEGTLVGDREGREHRRLFDKMLTDFEAALAPPPPTKSSSRPRPGPPQIGLDDHLTQMRQQRGGSG